MPQDPQLNSFTDVAIGGQTSCRSHLALTHLHALFMQDFAWSPTDSIMCAYQSEQAGGNLPARLSLIKLPERQELRQKNLFSVSGKSAMLFGKGC